MPRVEFHFDFGSPNAYLSHIVLPEIERRTGASFEYVPILLGGVFKATNNRSPIEAFKDIKNKLSYERLETKRFIAKHGISRFKMNPFFPVNTLALMRGAIAAQEEDLLKPYVDAVFSAMWAEPQKMDDPEVIRTALDAAGLPGAKLVARTQEQTVKDKLAKSTEASVLRGTFGSPTFFVGEEIFFGKDKLRDVEEEIVRQRQ
ncbi:MAG TPA: 2-hydroxychromene-2-carboxylate isomerase [Xanthobacteraceae bacterium]|nr:2-hydroxychromene-2-carboxylate isomerase [Xanthobacteraceae bacterium]